MAKWCPVCLETVEAGGTIWPYVCGHSICKSCHKKSFESNNYTCPECRGLPLCPYAEFLHNHNTHNPPLPPGAVQRLYHMTQNPSDAQIQLPHLVASVVPMPQDELPDSDPDSDPDSTLAAMAFRALETINSQFLNEQQEPQGQQEPQTPIQTAAVDRAVENPPMAAVAARALEIINTQLDVSR